MAYRFFAMLSRMRYIQRWGLMRNTFTENIQEHSHQVAVLAHALATMDNQIFGGTVSPDRCAASALFHDASEILTGDLPTPIKYYNPAIKKAYKEVEKISCDKLISMMPPPIRATYEPLLLESEPEVAVFVKAADKLSAHIKCIEELKAGNLEFESAAQTTKEALVAMNLPALDYFMEHCLGSFALNLDQLQ